MRFQPEYWSSDQLVDAGGNVLGGRKAPAANTNEFTQAEFNFAMFWGVAIQAYESTLVSDNSRFDQFSEGNSQALTAQEQRGLNLFRRSDCTECHTGAEFTAASFSSVLRAGACAACRQRRRPGIPGFSHGIRPIAEDIGLGRRQSIRTPFSQAVAQFGVARTVVDGIFKTPDLRNAEFTGRIFTTAARRRSIRWWISTTGAATSPLTETSDRGSGAQSVTGRSRLAGGFPQIAERRRVQFRTRAVRPSRVVCTHRPGCGATAQLSFN